jgi:hypothetical protein
MYDGYQFPEGKVTSLPNRATQKLIVARGYDEKTNGVAWPKTTQKCLLCKQRCDEQHAVFGRVAYAHHSCIRTGLQALNRPTNRANRPVSKAPTPETAYSEQDREDARLLVRALAQILRGE